MPWDETDEYIRSGHRDPDEFQADTFRTIDIDVEKGVKAIVAKPKGSDKMEVQSFLFSKEKGWTLDKAKQWFQQHMEAKQIVFENLCVKEGKKIKGVAAYAGVSRNRNLYLPEELAKADGVEVPIYWSHDYSKPPLGKAVFHWNPELEILEYEGEVSDGVSAQYVSIAAEYDYSEEFHNLFVPRNLRFVELSLTNNPGFPLTSVVAESKKGVVYERLTVTQTSVVNATEGVAPQHLKAEEERGSKIEAAHAPPTSASQTKPQASKDAGLSIEYTNNSPDDSSVNPPRLRNVLASLPQTETNLECKERVRRHLEDRVKRLGVGQAAQQKEEVEMENKEEERKVAEAAAKQPIVTLTAEETPSATASKVKESRYQTISRALKRVVETIDSTGASAALGQVWQPDMITLPAGLAAGLRKFAEVVEIPQGADRVHFTRVTTPTFAALTEGSAPSDVSQTIDRVTATPVERGAKQTITYGVIESSTPDIIEAVERSLQTAAILDEDGVILSALDAASGIAATIYGGNKTSENQITASDTIKASDIAKAFTKIMEQGFAVIPGDLVCVLSPKQYHDLLQDTAVQNAFQYGSLGGGLEEGVVGRLYGVDIAVSTKVPTGSGSGSPPVTTYHAFVFKKREAVGLGIGRSLLIETERRVDERKVLLMASHRIAAAVKVPNAVVKIITA